MDRGGKAMSANAAQGGGRSGLRDLPDHIVRFLESGVVAEFATLTAAGAPIDTPTYYFPKDDLSTIDLATSLQQPVKAERARRDPKVGLMIEGRPEEPVVLVRGHAAVRDSDLQANAIRYIAETGFKGISHGISWAEARKALTYWTRILVEVAPVRVIWWDDQAAMDGPPQVWDAPAAGDRRASDPAPPGGTSRSPWPPRPWREVAEEALGRGLGAHLCVVDDAGWPMPMLTRSCELTDEGFRLATPSGAPWPMQGTANLTFAGFHNFVGEALPQPDGATLFRVERALPQSPATRDTKEVLQPSEETRHKATERLEYELKRRGQSLPEIPLEPPAPTRLRLVREARLASDAPITGITKEMGNRSS
jgi:hypothetical protein